MGLKIHQSMFSKKNIRASLVTLVVLTEVLFFVLSHRIVDEANSDIEITEQSIGGIDGSQPLLEMLRLNGLYRGLCTGELIKESDFRLASESCVFAKNNAQQQLLSSAFDFDRELWRKAADESDPLRFFELVNEWNSVVTSKLDQIYRESGLTLNPDPSRHSLAEMYSILLPRLVDKTGIIRGQQALLKAQILDNDAFIESKTLVNELQSGVRRALQLLASTSEYDDLKLRFNKIAANLQQYSKDLEASYSGKRVELDTDKDLSSLFLQGTEIINDLSLFADEVESQLKLEFEEGLRLQESALFNKYLILLLVQTTLILIYIQLFWLIRAQEDAVQRAEISASGMADSVRELREAQSKQAQMFSIVSHELRTPLSSTKMIYDDICIETLDEYGPMLRGNNDAVLAILDDLRMVIDPSKAKDNKTSNAKPAAIVEQTLKSLHSLLERQGVQAHLSYDTLSGQEMLFNTGALRQIVTNLVKNAAIHSEGANIWVTLSGFEDTPAKASMVLRIEDDGKGIPDDQKHELFNAFSRGDTKADGTGLGLFIIRELVDMLGCDITCFDSERGGVGFEFRCKLEFYSKGLDQAAKPEFSASQLEAALKGKRILFAEDQLTIQMLTKSTLTKAGASVAVCDNGVAAMKAFKLDQYDLVLTDAMMPEMDGYQLCVALRGAGFEGPIIAVTAATIGDEQERLLQSGANKVLSKPLPLKELKEYLLTWESQQ